MSSSRERKLDALYAERVLHRPCAFYGCEFIPLSLSPGPVEITPGVEWKESEPHPFGVIGPERRICLLWKREYPERWIGFGREDSVPHYTRSLDAAWEGVARLKLDCGLAVSLVPDGSGKYWASGSIWEPFDAPPSGEGDHPAEALVLACLRAVGVTEEEIEACSVID